MAKFFVIIHIFVLIKQTINSAKYEKYFLRYATEGIKVYIYIFEK